jgi:hypothetical protein
MITRENRRYLGNVGLNNKILSYSRLGEVFNNVNYISILV